MNQPAAASEGLLDFPYARADHPGDGVPLFETFQLPGQKRVWQTYPEPPPSPKLGLKHFIGIHGQANTEGGTDRTSARPAGSAARLSAVSDGVYADRVRVVPAEAASLMFDDPPSTAPKDKPAPSPVPSPAKPPTPQPPAPSLDELLGIKDKKPASPPPADPPVPAGDEQVPTDLTDPARSDLDRLLKGEEIGDAFTAAVGLMDDAANRLGQGRDAGLATQRVQEDVVRRLDQLLASLQKRQSQSSSSSSSSSQSQESQSQKSQPNQKKPQGQKPSPQQGEGTAGERRDLGPGRQDGALKPALEAARAAWGALPERVRDMLLQGSSDRFSAKYQAMTEAYYKRLAEERK